MLVCCECWVLSGRGLGVDADHSSRGVLPSVVCLSVVVKPWYCEGPAPLGPSVSMKTKCLFVIRIEVSIL